MFHLSRDEGENRWKLGPSDQAIAARVIGGETHLFEVLMRRHNQRLYRAVRGLLKDETEIEDVMQQTYVDAFTNLRQLRGATSLSSWLVRIAINEALSRLRRRNRFATEMVDSEPQDASDGLSRERGEDPEERASHLELIRLLEAVLDELPAGYRVVFLLREVEEMDTRETAFALDVSEDVVKTRLRRSKLLIRRQLGRRIAGAKPRAFAFHATRCNRVVEAVFHRIVEAGGVLSEACSAESFAPWRH